MKYAKVLMIIFLAATLVGTIVFTSNEAMAKVGDHVEAVCSVCHTMHHSQDGVDPDHGWKAGEESAGPNPALLYASTVYTSENNSTCVACHTMESSDTGTLGYDPVTGAPQVDLAAAKLLAGGTYGDTTQDDENVHNVLGLYDPDENVEMEDGTKNIPPGGANTDIGGAAQITCAGTTGCHGDRYEDDNLKAVHGAHHTDDTTIDGLSLGTSFRFLTTDVVDATFDDSGVDGIEHSYWEADEKDKYSNDVNPDADEHNVYDSVGINKVCASCHGDFHGHGAAEQGDGGPNDPWLRHPTDISLSEASTSGPTDEYDSYPNDGTYKYSLQAPIGFTTPDTPTTDQTLGMVLCISCHRAHGSEYEDILRWCYSEMKATGGDGDVDDGCNACHTTK